MPKLNSDVILGVSVGRLAHFLLPELNMNTPCASVSPSGENAFTAGQTRFFCTHFQEDERHDRLLRKRQAEGLPVLLLLRQTRLYAEGLLL